MKRKLLAALLSSLTALSLYAGAPATAQEWPSRPIRVFTTSSAGGISDIFMRALGDELRQKLGQPLVIENRPGGMQNVGSRACADAPPDGYTVCIINADPLVYNQFLIKNMTFNPETSLQPVVNLFHLIQVLVINPQLGAKTIDDLIAESKAKPGVMNYVTASVPLALYMETLRKEKGADWVRVPFRGGGEAVNAVLSGTTPIALIGEGNVIGQIKAGTVRPLVMLNNLKSPLVPEVPTMEESGYKGAPSRTWYGLFVPAGTPRPIVDRLNKDIREIVSKADFREKHLTSRSLVPALNSPEEFAQEIIADRAVAKQVVKDSGLEPQ
jgi:tripartite-type tricarboxylate transporter receptor subunit TctC